MRHPRWHLVILNPLTPPVKERKCYKLMPKIVQNGLSFGTKLCGAAIFVTISAAILHKNYIFKINWICTWPTKKRNKSLLDSLNFMSWINYLPQKETRQLILSNKDIRSLPLSYCRCLWLHYVGFFFMVFFFIKKHNDQSLDKRSSLVISGTLSINCLRIMLN